MHFKCVVFLEKGTTNPPTNIVDFRGFVSSIILIYRGGIPRSMEDFPESLSQAMLYAQIAIRVLCWGNIIYLDYDLLYYITIYYN